MTKKAGLTADKTLSPFAARGTAQETPGTSADDFPLQRTSHSGPPRAPRQCDELVFRTEAEMVTHDRAPSKDNG
jgi:hypothetical protein